MVWRSFFCPRGFQSPCTNGYLKGRKGQHSLTKEYRWNSMLLAPVYATFQMKNWETDGSHSWRFSVIESHAVLYADILIDRLVGNRFAFRMVCTQPLLSDVVCSDVCCTCYFCVSSRNHLTPGFRLSLLFVCKQIQEEDETLIWRLGNLSIPLTFCVKTWKALNWNTNSSPVSWTTGQYSHIQQVYGRDLCRL